MPSSVIQAVITDRTVLQAFARLVHLADSPDDFYRDAGELLINNTRKRIRGGIQPDGTPFKPLDPRYAKKKRAKVGNRPILEYDVHMVGDQFGYQIDSDGLLVGTKAKYGRRQYYGDPKPGIHARPWLGLSDEDRHELKSTLSHHLLDALHQKF